MSNWSGSFLASLTSCSRQGSSFPDASLNMGMLLLAGASVRVVRGSCDPTYARSLAAMTPFGSRRARQRSETPVLSGRALPGLLRSAG